MTRTGPDVISSVGGRSYAADCRQIQQLVTRIRSEPIHRRHLVAIVPSEGGILLFTNAPDAPEEAQALEGGLIILPLSSLLKWPLKQQNLPLLAFPALEAIRPELSQRSPRIFDLEGWLHRHRGNTLLDTRRTLAERHELELNQRRSRLERGDVARLIIQIQSLRLANLLSSLPLKGLLAIIPGYPLADTARRATLIYTQQVPRLPSRTLFTAQVLSSLEDLKPLLEEKVQALKEQIAGQPSADRAHPPRPEQSSAVFPTDEDTAITCFVPAVLGTLVATCEPGFSQTGSLEHLLLSSGQVENQSRGVTTLADALRTIAGNRSVQLLKDMRRLQRPRETVLQWLRGSRQRKGWKQRIGLAEQAYVTLTITGPEPWREAGFERILWFAHRNLVETLRIRKMESGPTQPFFEALYLWYRGPDSDSHRVEEENTRPSRQGSVENPAPIDNTASVEAHLKEVRTCLDRFRAHEASFPLERGRARDLAQAIELIIATARRGIGGEYHDTLVEIVGRTSLRSETPWSPRRDEDVQNYALHNMFRLLLLTARFESLLRDVEVSPGSPLVRPDRLHRLAMRIRCLPHFERCFPHERAIFAYMCQGLARSAELRADQLGGHPFLQVVPLSREIVQHSTSAVTIQLENQGAVPAETVFLRLFPSYTHTTEGETQFHWEVIRPGTPVTALLQLTTTQSTFVELTFEFSYEGQQGGAEAHTIRLSVIRPATALPPPQRPEYPIGHHVENFKLFQGRRQELNLILSHLAGEARQNFLIRGPRRCGKSSLLYILKRILEEADVRRHFGFPESWDGPLASNIPIFVNAQSLENRREPLDLAFYRLLLQEVGQSAHFSHIRNPPSFSTDAIQVAHPAQGFRNAMKGLLSQLETDVGILFLVDELDAIHGADVGGFFAEFRTILDNETRLAWILVSATGLREASSDYSSPLFNVFHTVDLDTLSLDDVRELARKPAPGIQFLDEAINEIFAQAGGNTFLTNLMCSAVIDQLYQERTNVVRRQTVQITVNQLLSKLGKNRSFDFVWQENDNLARALLITLMERRQQQSSGTRSLAHAVSENARFPQSIREMVSAAATEASLEQLRDQGILTRTGGTWRFAVPLIETWLKTAILGELPEIWFREEG